MKFYSLLFIALCLFSCKNKFENITTNSAIDFTKELIKGERIDGPANVRSEVNGKLLFELQDQTLVETTPAKNNWLEVGVFCDPSILVGDDFYILPNKKMYDVTGAYFGITRDTVPVLFSGEGYLFINGFTHQQNINQNTVPERVLENLLKAEAKHFNDFYDFLIHFQFEVDESSLFKDLKAYTIPQSLLLDLSPSDRLTLLFKDDILLGYVHSRTITNSNFTTHDLIDGHQLSLDKKVDSFDVEILIQALNEWYSAVD